MLNNTKAFNPLKVKLLSYVSLSRFNVWIIHCLLTIKKLGVWSHYIKIRKFFRKLYAGHKKYWSIWTGYTCPKKYRIKAKRQLTKSDSHEKQPLKWRCHYRLPSVCSMSSQITSSGISCSSNPASTLHSSHTNAMDFLLNIKALSTLKTFAAAKAHTLKTSEQGLIRQSVEVTPVNARNHH